MNQKTQTKRSFPYVTVLLIALLVIAAAVLVYSLLSSTGIFGRMQTAVKSDNYRINENELCLYKYQVAQNQFYYAYLYDSYGMTNYGISNYFSSPDEYINYMLHQSVISGSTDFDEQAYAYAVQYLAYCEGAKAAGVKLDDEDKAEIDTYMDNLKTMAEANGVSLSAYIKSWVGAGVSKSDVRKAMEIAALGSKYAEMKEDEFSDAVTLDNITVYRDEHKSSFYSTKYTSYKLVDEDLVEKAKACKTVEELKTLLVNYYMDKDFDSAYKTEIEDKNVTDEAGKEQTRADVLASVLIRLELEEGTAVFPEAEDETETETETGAETKSDDKKEITYTAAGRAIVEKILKSANTQIAKISTSGSANYADPTSDAATDLQKWLFGDGRATGDTNVITVKSKDDKGTETSTSTWYLVGDDVMVLDTDKTRRAYYAVLKDTENGMTAEEKYEAFKAASDEEKAAKFEELFDATLSESISETSFSDERGEWLFDEDRKEGDYTRLVIKTTDSDKKETSTEYVLLYMGENDENWKVSARSAITEEKLSDWVDEMIETYHIESNYKAKETEAATEAKTEAATEAKTEAAS